jgi:hypothetical protein
LRINTKYAVVDFQDILNGARPSEVFRWWLAADPDRDKYGVAREFADAFPNVDSVCKQMIWNWRAPGSPPHSAILDAQLDELLLDLIVKAGYVVSQPLKGL